MRYILTFFAVFLIAFIQTTFFSFNFLLALVLILDLFWPLTLTVFWAFLAGLLFDLTIGRFLGLSSLGFILCLILLTVFRQRFSVYHPLSCFVVSFLSYLMFSFITYGQVNWFEGIIISAFAAIVHYLFKPAFDVSR